MKLLKKILLITLIVLASLVIAPKIVPGMENTVSAANVKISSKKKTMYKGYTYLLKVTGTSKKVIWSSSDKSKATVSSKGKVYAKKNGKVTITAKVGNKKYTCKVTVKNKPYNFIQFKNTTFYDLKDVALEYRKTENIKNYKDFVFDLDGDGKKDKITLKNVGKNEYGYTNFELRYNGKKILDEDIEFLSSVYIADLNKDDKNLELIVKLIGPNDMVRYIVYYKKGNKIKEITDYINGAYCTDNELKINQKGKMVLNNSDLEYISPKVFNKYYQFKNNKISTKKLNVKDIKNVKFSTTDKMLFISNMDNLYKVSEYYSDSKKYDEEKAFKYAGIIKGKFKSFNILNFTEGGEVKVKLRNGTKGYLFRYSGHLAG